MVIERAQLVEMIAEAIRERLAQLHEKGARPGTEDAEETDDDDGQDAGSSTDPKAKAELGNLENDPVANPKKPQDQQVPDLDAGDGGSSEDQARDERDALDVDGDAANEPSGKINDMLSGKTIQSVTLNPKSEVAGAKEVVLATNETTDVLRIVIHPSGKVQFLYRNQSHDIP